MTEVDFRAQIARLPLRALKATYPKEHRSFAEMMRRHRKAEAHVDDEMRTFAGFLTVLGPKPFPTATVDRIDNNGAYRAGNVRWASKQVQANNRSNTTFLVVDGRRLPLTDWARITDQNPDTLRGRRRRGKPDELIVYPERAKAVPADEVSTPPPQAEAVNRWPEGCKSSDWENPYRAWLALQPPPQSDCTRAVFCNWLSNNRVRAIERLLEGKYGHGVPTASDPIFSTAMPDDIWYADVLMSRARRNSSAAMMLTKQERELSLALQSGRPQPTLPAEAVEDERRRDKERKADQRRRGW